MIKTIEEALKWLPDALIMWWTAVVRPVATLNTLLEDPNEGLAGPMKIWIPALSINLLIMLPVLKLFGIKSDNASFMLLYFLLIFISYMAFSFFVHRFLTAFGLRSQPNRTLVMLVTPAVVYNPLFYPLILPTLIQQLTVLKSIKDLKLPIGDAARAYLQAAFSPTGEDPLVMVSLMVVSLLSYAVMTITVEAMCQWYRNDRFKTYVAFTLAVFVAGLVIYVLTPLHLLAMYANIE